MNIIPVNHHELTDDKHPALTYLAQLQSKQSRRTMWAALENIAQCFKSTAYDFPWHQIGRAHVTLILAELSKSETGYAPATINRHHAALRGVLKECWRHEYITAEKYMRLIDFKGAKGSREVRSRYVAPAEFDLLVATCEQSIKGVRDKAILYVLYMCGLRRDELVNLQLGNLKRDAIQLVGKGNKERTVPMNTDVIHHLKAWTRLIPTGDTQYLFCNSKGEPLTAQSVYVMLETRSKRAGIDIVRPHDLRHAFISNLWDTGTDGATIAALAGHSNIKQTQEYDRRPEETKRKAVNLLNREQ